MLDSVGPDAPDPGLESAPLNPLHGESFTGSWWDRYLRSFAGTIAGGTSQIQRNIIAERVLGLPLTCAAEVAARCSACVCR